MSNSVSDPFADKIRSDVRALEEAEALLLAGIPEVGSDIGRLAARLKSSSTTFGLPDIAAAANLLENSEEETLIKRLQETLDTVRDHLSSRSVSRVRVLCIGSDSTITDLVRSSVGEPEVEVLTADTAAEADRILAGPDVSLVVMSLFLGDEDGRFYLQRLKQDPPGSEIPVLVVSDLEAPLIALEAISFGAEGYFRKPVDVQKFSRSVNNILSGDVVRQPLFAGEPGNAHVLLRRLFQEVFVRSQVVAESDNVPVCMMRLSLAVPDIESQKMEVAGILSRIRPMHQKLMFAGSWRSSEVSAVFIDADLDDVESYLRSAVFDVGEETTEVMVAAVARVESDDTFGDVTERLDHLLYTGALSSQSIVRSDRPPTPQCSGLLAISVTDRDFARSFEQQLLEIGIESTYYDQRTDSPDSYAEQAPDLIVVDLDLQGNEGLYLLHTLRRREAFEDTAILALVDFARPNDAVRALRMGANDYLFKPFVQATLHSRIRDILRRFGRRDRLEQPFVVPASAEEPEQSPSEVQPVEDLAQAVEPEAFRRAFGEAIRSLVERSESFDLPTLGRFHIVHHPSRIEHDEDGMVVVQPPRNEVEFESE